MANCLLAGVEYYLRHVWDKIPCRKRVRKSIVLLVVGLDNAGKSAVVNYLYNKSLVTKESVVPTIGFRTVTFNYKSCSIRLYDIGGGPQIRALWPKYYADVHGVIYVVDSTDVDRLSENTKVFQELVCHELITQKPILFLGNKQDLEYAIDELDLIEYMNIERIVNFAKCYTRVEICSCYPDKNKGFSLNKNIDKGFKWLVGTIDYYYEALEKEMYRRKLKKRYRRSFTLKSWTAQSIENSFDYPDTDSETYMKPIIPKDETPRKKRKRVRGKCIRKLCCINNNKTGPMPVNSNGSSAPTTESMKELIRNIRIEDLINNMVIEENPISEYRRPRRPRRKKRPQTAPAIVKPFQVNPIESAQAIA